MINVELSSKNCYIVRSHGKMKADVLIYLNPQLYKDHFEEQALQQLVDASTLEGVISPVIGLPDIHSGFGLPIGGVMSMDAENGLVSAGAVGMDINCGVRLLRTNISASSVGKEVFKSLISATMKRVPGGVGQKSRHAPLIKKHFRELVHRGAPFLIELGYGRPEDPECIEDSGCMKGAEIDCVSSKAVERGLQLSTIGGGNHFIEFGVIDKVFEAQTASVYGLNQGSLSVMIHTGSRGFGHQICTDYSKEMKAGSKKYNISIPNAGLAAVPIRSDIGKSYLAAMSCAGNFAYCNRQWITDDLRRAFTEVFKCDNRDCGLELVYDITHNTARFEDIKGQKVLVHRKGATRALPPGHRDNPARYFKTGHPVLIPGSMGSASYIVRADKNLESVFNSVNHGAGRVLSRSAAKREIPLDELKRRMANIVTSGNNYRAFLDEAPQAYKDIDLVIETLTEIGMISKVARLLPLAVVKGDSA